MFSLLLLLIGYTVAVFGGGAFVEWALARLLGEDDLTAIEEFRSTGLRDGGKIIGWLERFLFVTFLLSGSYAAVGLVLAAKGVIRYGEIRDPSRQKVAEYVLIGTMLSLSWALIISVVLMNLTG